MNLLRLSQAAEARSLRLASKRKHNRKRRLTHAAHDRARCAEWRKRNPDKVAQYTQTYLDKRRGSAFGMVERAMLRARKLSIPFALTEADIAIPEFCPVLGMRLVPGRGPGGGHDASPSLDRIVPALGYVPGNVRVISKRANTLKLDATLEEIQAVCRWLERELALRNA